MFNIEDSAVNNPPSYRHLVRRDTLFSKSRCQPLLAQHALRRLGNGVGVGVSGLLPFLGDDPTEDVFVDLKVAVDFRQCFGFDEKLHLPHHGLCQDTEVRCLCADRLSRIKIPIPHRTCFPTF